ncbi:MAG: hypothetical protein ACU4F9_10070 [Arcticibacter sp.]
MKNQLTITTHPVVVASGATLLFMESVLLFRAPILLLDVLMVFSLTLSVYSFPSRNEASVSYKTINWMFFALAVTSAIIAILLSGLLHRMLVLGIAFILFLLYRFGASIGFSFRGSPLLKGPVIALCWTIITVYLPFSLYDLAIETSDLFSLAILNFSMVMAMAWLCDLADLKNDVQEGLQTISVQLGPKRTISMVLMVMMACTIALTLFNPLSSIMFKGSVFADVLTGLAIIAVTILPASSAKWMVDALLLCKPLAVICMLA